MVPNTATHILILGVFSFLFLFLLKNDGGFFLKVGFQVSRLGVEAYVYKCQLDLAVSYGWILGENQCFCTFDLVFPHTALHCAGWNLHESLDDAAAVENEHGN